MLMASRQVLPRAVLVKPRNDFYTAAFAGLPFG